MYDRNNYNESDYNMLEMLSETYGIELLEIRTQHDEMNHQNEYWVMSFPYESLTQIVSQINDINNLCQRTDRLYDYNNALNSKLIEIKEMSKKLDKLLNENENLKSMMDEVLTICKLHDVDFDLTKMIGISDVKA